MSLLFQLLISLEYDSLSDLDPKLWNFEKAHLPTNFDHYITRIRQGVKSIRPNLDLILRHTSGALFQEAHKEVLYFDLQRDLFGGLSSNLITKVDSYSSIHYTPPYVARTIVENVLKEIDLTCPKLKILDPSCGSSEFLIEALKQLKDKNYSGEISLIGYDTSQSAVETSKFLLHYENQTQWAGKIIIKVKLVDDSLSKDWGNDNSLILMNPPFVSWEQLKNKESRDLLKDVLGTSFAKGRPNQASAFFYKASKSLNENGVLGCVLPSSIFTFDSYNLIRNRLEEELNLKLLGKLGNFVFEDALTDVSIFIGKIPKLNSIPKLIWTKNEKGVAQDTLRELRKLEANNENSKVETLYSIYTPSSFPLLKDNWKILSYEEDKFRKELERYTLDEKLTRISSVFHIKQGALLGVQNIFTINQDEFNDLPINEKSFFRIAVTNDSLKNGYINIKEYVWYPYDSDGLIIKTEEEANNIRFVQNKLIPFKKRLLDRRGVKFWWELTRPRNWQFESKPRLYSSRFGNSDSFGFDRLGNTVVIEGNAIIPKIKFDEDDYYFYLAVFSSNLFNKLLSVYSKQLAGGKWYDLGKKYISNIPIPNLKNIDKISSNYIKLVYLGREIEKGNSYTVYSINEELQFFYPNF